MAQRFADTCHSCQLVSRPDPPEPIRNTTLPEGPWEFIAMDHKGPLPSGDYLLVIIDYFSRYPEVEITRSMTGKKNAEILSVYFARYGAPRALRTDNALGFLEKEFQTFLANWGVKHTTSPLFGRQETERRRDS